MGTVAGVLLAKVLRGAIMEQCVVCGCVARRLPIGLARASMLLPADGGTAAAGGAAGKRGSLTHPLLGAGSGPVPADVEQPLGLALEPAGSTASDDHLLPHAQRAQQQEAALGHGKAAAAAWRATIPATLACTMALFVQKMVQQVPSHARCNRRSLHTTLSGLGPAGVQCLGACMPCNL